MIAAYVLVNILRYPWKNILLINLHEGIFIRSSSVPAEYLVGKFCCSPSVKHQKPVNINEKSVAFNALYFIGNMSIFFNLEYFKSSRIRESNGSRVTSFPNTA